MNLFEFLMVLVSIIIGLGLAELLTGVAGLIRERGQVRTYWVHSLLILALFLAMLQQWWEAWGLQSTSEWTFIGLSMMLAGPICFFLIIHLMFPRPLTSYRDLADYYYERTRPVWWLAATAVTVSTLFRPLVFDMQLVTMDNFASLPVLIICVLAATFRNRALHGVLVTLLVGFILFDILGRSYQITG
ncbi:MAG: hypothetical protein QNJ40_04135 [Xanthomonadales bacterium]|nr:hypothetical protein [Xanthomonadales bacterium]